MNGKNVGKPADVPVLHKCTKGLTMERSPMYIKNVVKHSAIPVIPKNIKEFTVERDPMNVRRVEKPSNLVAPYKHKKGLRRGTL